MKKQNGSSKMWRDVDFRDSFPWPVIIVVTEKVMIAHLLKKFTAFFT
jgi:hypothetical protein